MAIYHCSIKIITRGKGKSAVAAAAYRAAALIKSERDGEIHDYTRKGGVVHTEILLPEHAPAELTPEQNISLARRYALEQFVSRGMCADVCVHDKGDGNPHAHIMLTMRPFDESGNWAAKSRKEYILDGNGEKIRLPSGAFKSRKVNAVDWNDKTKAEDWRKAWAAYCNAALRVHGHDAVLDHRSYERQGIEQIPTVHLGAAASQMERQGIATERGNLNREIAVTNREIRQLRARINKTLDWLKTEAANTTPPTLTDVISEILSHRECATQYAKIADLKTAAKVFNFLQENHISDMEGLAGKVSAMNGKLHSMGENLNKIDRRLKTLDEHIRHSENFKNGRGQKARYEKLYAEYKTARKQTGLFAERKVQKALDAAQDYYEANRTDITLYEAAERYLRDVLQGRFDVKKLPPMTKWKEERAAKTAEQKALYADYYRLRDEVKNAEAIKRSVEQLVRVDEPKKAKMRSYEMSL